MRWLALCCTPEAPDGDRDALGWLALGFTPRVARLEEAVVAEVSASLRLFRGARALRERLQAEAAGLALGAVAWAPTALGALALARCPERPGRGRWNEGPGRGRLTEQPGQGGSSGRPAKGRPNERLGQGQPNEEPGQLPLSEPPPQRWLSERLDALPLAALSAAHAHHAMLARLGCRHLGTLRRLPRAALAKRFGPALLTALDQAYGDLPEVHDWLTLPERFDARLELPYRVEHAPVLLHFAEALLRQLGIFLAARHAGVRALRLGWQHDAMRPRDVADRGELSIATADTTRDVQRLSRLLGEHLARTELAAPAGEIRLSADTLLPLHDLPVAGLLPGASGDAQERLTANALLERLSVRLGAERVREGRLH
jgi:protein ImuB